MSVLDSLGQSQKDAVLRGLANGDYNVLLGAGASRDSKGPGPEFDALPLAGELSAMLSTKFGTPTDSDLVASYDRACRGGRTPAVYDFLREKLYGCRPATWYEHFVQVPWNRIWTFNIDDVVEAAYKHYSQIAWTHPSTSSFDDPFLDDSGREIVHLHGHVHDVKPRPLVFSILEYINARSRGASWHPIFGDQWHNRPFIVVGARLVDEFDLADIIRTRNPRSALPTVFVSNVISETVKFDLNSWNVATIEANAETFFTDLLGDLAPSLRRADQPWTRASKNPALLRFAQQFRQLTQETVVDPEPLHDLYRGDPPVWSDICRDLDSEMEWSALLTSKVLRQGSSEQSFNIAIGPRLSGKSTGLLRAAKNLDAAGFGVFLFRSESGLDVNAVLTYLRSNPATVLAFDGVADYIRSVGNLLDAARAEGLQCRIIAVERDVSLSVVLARITSPFFLPQNLIEVQPVEEMADPARTYRTTRKFARMERHDAMSIVGKLDEKGRLDNLEDLDDEARVGVFVRNGLFAGLERASRGPAFRQRIQKGANLIKRKEVLQAAVLVSLIDSLNYSTPLGYLSVVGIDDVSKAFDDDELGEFVISRRDSMMARHRSLGLDPLVRTLGQPDTRALIIECLVHIKPYVTEKTLQLGSRDALVARGLLRAKALQHWIGTDGLPVFYEELADDYGWNSRFWEQRAIAGELQKNPNWEEVESHAARAAAMTPDDHRLNTLGAVIINRAIQTCSARERLFWEFLDRGRAQFQLCRSSSPQNPVPVQTFLKLVIRCGEKCLSDGLIVGEQLRSDFNSYYSDARHMPAFEFGPLATELRELQLRWAHVLIQ